MKIGDRVFVHGYIDEIRKDTVIIRNNGGYFGTIPSEVITGELPSAQPLTDVEQRIFLRAISREEEICRKVDAEWGEGDEECEINLVHACHEITRKVKGALWGVK